MKFTVDLQSAADSEPQSTMEEATNGVAEHSEDGRRAMINIEQQEAPDFRTTRFKLFPVLKQQSWMKTTKELLDKNKITHSEFVYFPVKSTTGFDVGYTVAIVEEGGTEMQYVLTSYLDAWKVKKDVLNEIAINNLRQKAKDCGETLWRKSDMGVYYVDESFGNLAASLILLPEMMTHVEREGSIILHAPSTDLCMMAGAKDAKKLCVMGEIAYRYYSEPLNFGFDPLRLLPSKKWSPYKANISNEEFAVPKNPDDIMMLRRNIAAYSGK